MIKRAYVKAPRNVIGHIVKEQHLKVSFYTVGGCIIDFTSIVEYWFFVERLEQLGGRTLEHDHNNKVKYP